MVAPSLLPIDLGDGRALTILTYLRLGLASIIALFRTKRVAVVTGSAVISVEGLLLRVLPTLAPNYFAYGSVVSSREVDRIADPSGREVDLRIGFTFKLKMQYAWPGLTDGTDAPTNCNASALE